MLQVSIARTDPAARSTFTVARIEPMTALDVLLAVQREQDDSLGFRFSCRVAMCGTCTIRVNGRSVLAWQRLVSADEPAIAIAPAAGFPVVRDLVVDTTAFWREWAAVRPWLTPRADLTEPAVVPPGSAERRAIDPALDCIQCGACYSSCGVAGDTSDFLGPAALNRALVLINDSRDAAAAERLDTVSGARGVDRCHFMYGCTAVCPKGLDPAAAIRRLRTGRIDRGRHRAPGADE